MFDYKKSKNNRVQELKKTPTDQPIISKIEFDSSHIQADKSQRSKNINAQNHLQKLESFSDEEKGEVGKMELTLWNKTRSTKLFNFEFFPQQEGTLLSENENPIAKNKVLNLEKSRILNELAQMKIYFSQTPLGKRNFRFTFRTNNSTPIEMTKQNQEESYFWKDKNKNSLFKMTVMPDTKTFKENPINKNKCKNVIPNLISFFLI
jgi:hypothetical protein